MTRETGARRGARERACARVRRSGRRARLALDGSAHHCVCWLSVRDEGHAAASEEAEEAPGCERAKEPGHDGPSYHAQRSASARQPPTPPQRDNSSSVTAHEVGGAPRQRPHSVLQPARTPRALERLVPRRLARLLLEVHVVLDILSLELGVKVREHCAATGAGER